MKNTLKVLNFFVENKEKTITINQLAKALKMNYRIIYEEAIKLEKDGLIKITRIGNANLCQFFYQYNSKIVEIEEIRKIEVSKNKDIQLICKRIREVKNPFYVLLLFGSYVRKAETKHSDIDLCLISDNKKVCEEVQTIIQITPLNVQLQVFTIEQFTTMIKNKNENIGNEIVKSNIIFHGLESFYELINNAA